MNQNKTGVDSIFSLLAEKQEDIGTPKDQSPVNTIEGMQDGGSGSETTPTITAMIDSVIAAAVPDEEQSNSIYSPAIRRGAVIGATMVADQQKAFNPKIAGYDGGQGKSLYPAIGQPFSDVPGAGFSMATNTIEHYEELAMAKSYGFAATFNLNAPVQDAFSANFFKLYSLSPNSIGYTVSSEEVVLINQFEHGANGEPMPSRGTPVIRALDDPAILDVDHTKIVPVVLPDREKYFTDAAIIAPKPIEHLGESVEIAPLRPGVKIDLIALGRSLGDMATDVVNRTDTIDPAIHLNSIQVKFGDDIVNFSTTNMPSAVYTYVGTANDRRMTIGLEINELVITKDKKDHAGADLVTLAAIAADDLKARYSIYIAGYVDLDSGTTHMSIASAELHSVRDADDNIVPKDAAAWLDLETLGEDSELVGFYLDASMTNANRREIGQLFEIRGHHQPYTVPYISPITMLRATGQQSTDSDQRIISVLTSVARLKGNLDAARLLLKHHREMSEYAGVLDDEGNFPDILSPARYLMNPVYVNHQLDLVDIVNNLSTHQVKDDCTHAIINYANTTLEELIRRTHILYNYEQRFGKGFKPTVVFGGSVRIMQYLNHPGNKDILFPGFNKSPAETTHPDWYDSAEKLDYLYISFDNPSANALDPLTHGVFAWAPVTPVVLNTPRFGGISKELTVMPRQAHNVSAVGSALLEVKNLIDMTTEPVIARVKAVV